MFNHAMSNLEFYGNETDVHKVPNIFDITRHQVVLRVLHFESLVYSLKVTDLLGEQAAHVNGTPG